MTCILNTKLSQCTDSVEFSPSPLSNNCSLLAVGTYQLIEATESTPVSKIGSIHCFRVDNDNEKIAEPFEPFQTIKTSAILDLKWYVYVYVCMCGVLK
jgi:hypothetical protein